MKALIASRQKLLSSFVGGWMADWNAHAIDRIIGHYSEDVVVRSPFVLSAIPESGGVVRGRDKLRDLYTRAIQKYPDLQFELISYYAGTESVVLLYRSVENLIAAETFHLNEKMQATQVFCHYSTEGT